MRSEIYVGRAHALKGKTALVQDDPMSTTNLVLAQFDDKELVWDGNQMGLGWHSFYAHEFESIQ